MPFHKLLTEHPAVKAAAAAETSTRFGSTEHSRAQQRLREVEAEVAPEVEAALFARHDEIVGEIREIVPRLEAFADELVELGHSAARLDRARRLGPPFSKREHLAGRLDAADILRKVAAGGGFLDWKSDFPGPAEPSS